MTNATNSCWVVHDGAAGNRRQAVALAESLASPFREWVLSSRRPWRWFAPRKIPGSAAAFGTEFYTTLGSPPDLVIGCGRQAALATRLAHDAGAKVLQILDPRISHQHWDWLIAPEHDGLHGDNVISMIGSLHPVTAAWLLRMRSEFPALAQLPGPRTAVFLGGPTPAVRFDRSAFEVLASKLEYWLARDGGSVMICGSSRTPAELAAVVRARYTEGPGRVWMDVSDGENPYPGALAWANRIIVSPDSVNMISEACASAVPVFIAEPNRATGRVRKFIASLESLGRVQAQERNSIDFAVTALQETARVAAVVRQRLGWPER